MKSRLIRTLMVVFCLVAGAPATQANTKSSLCSIVSLPSLCPQGGASASNVDSTGSVEQPPISSSISLDLDIKPAVRNSGGAGGIEEIAAQIAEEVQSNLRALTNHPVVYALGTGKWDPIFTARMPGGRGDWYGPQVLGWSNADIFCGAAYFRTYWWGEYGHCHVAMSIPSLAQAAYKSILDRARSDFNYYRNLVSNQDKNIDIPIRIELPYGQYDPCRDYFYSGVIRPSALKNAVARNSEFPAYSLRIDHNMYNLLSYSISGSVYTVYEDTCFYY